MFMMDLWHLNRLHLINKKVNWSVSFNWLLKTLKERNIMLNDRHVQCCMQKRHLTIDKEEFQACVMLVSLSCVCSPHIHNQSVIVQSFSFLVSVLIVPVCPLFSCKRHCDDFIYWRCCLKKAAFVCLWLCCAACTGHEVQGAELSYHSDAKSSSQSVCQPTNQPTNQAACHSHCHSASQPTSAKATRKIFS